MDRSLWIEDQQFMDRRPVYGYGYGYGCILYGYGYGCILDRYGCVLEDGYECI